MTEQTQEGATMTQHEQDERPIIHVHAEFESRDDVRVFYEIPEIVADMVRCAAALPDESFASCLHNSCLERAAALKEIKRLKREGKR